ncbi:MAG: hypothetical protein ACIAXF_16395 [Phycisphaerales bacterium JB063]
MPISTTTTTQPEQNTSAVTRAADGVLSGSAVDIWRDLAYKHRAKDLPKGLDAWWHAGTGRLRQRLPRRALLLSQAKRVCAMSGQFSELSQRKLKEQIAEMREVYRRGKDDDQSLLRAMALIRESAKRTMQMEHYPVQVAAGLGLTHNYFVELATGEGKTLVATSPAIIAGWRGRGCHLITVNDYLAQRDAETMRPLYEYCGLRVAFIKEDMPPPERRDAYAADITYCTNKSVTADYLRDRLALGRLRGLTDALLARRLRQNRSAALRGRADHLVMRGLDTAIIDEADSILIDEAVTPLIISTESNDAQRLAAFAKAAELAQQMKQGDDFTINRQYREADFTRRGKRRLAELCAGLDGYWQGARLREEMVNQALTARHLFLRDQHYVIQEGKVVIVDESTGRLMPDRSWRAGLHQAVEAKEGVDVTSPKETLARISFQRFFRGYRKLSAMSGTGWEARHELWQNHKLLTVRIPTHRPCIRKWQGERVFATTEQKLQHVADAVAQMHATGRPVLIGTRSVESSEALSALLTERNLPHRVLNAVRHAEEAAIVAQAGQRGAITVATNMAGRGTDIKLGPGVHKLGGLHVISVERNDSKRIDRQLIGRAGRQGDPGSAIGFAALDDVLVKRYGPKVARKLAAATPPARSTLLNRAQARAQRMGKTQRQQVMKMDDQLAEQLGFAGREH